MGGSGRAGPFAHRTPVELAGLVRRAENENTDAALKADLSDMFSNLLGAYNSRDVDLIRDRLDTLKSSIEDSIESSSDQFFGGSVAKHTYVDGLSDIDSLIEISNSELADSSPSVVLSRLASKLQQEIVGNGRVSVGRMAVTVDYADGMSIQMLPAIRTPDGKLKVPSSRYDRWSTINPDTFRTALTRRNDQCGGKLIPVIKLAKGVFGTLPDVQRLSGYHVESLAIAAFRNYQGSKTTVAMLPVFFEKMKDLVLSPLRDKTGQSIHVDEYLGPEYSEQRVTMSHVINRLAKRMRNATVHGSIAQWGALFDIDE